jgi:flagellar protein FliS
MDPRAAASAYRQDAFENAPPLKIVRLMYQGALRFLDAAMQCEPNAPGSRFVHLVGRADAVVSELRLALDAGQAPEVTANLEQLYLYVESVLQRALVERSTEQLPAARQVLATLLEAWTQVELDGAASARGAA